MSQFVRAIASSSPHSRGATLPHGRQRGVSMLELMLVVGLVGLLSAIAIPSYQRYVDRAKASRAVQDIGDIQMQVERFRTRQMRLPTSLTEAGRGGVVDPWGRAYRFYDYSSGAAPDPTRVDRNLRPLNTDYDLYSVGKDGSTEKQLNKPTSEDDIVRALDGSFIGFGKDF